MLDQSVFDEFFTLSVCIHEFFHTEWFGIRISGLHIAFWCMVIREWPVNIRTYPCNHTAGLRCSFLQASSTCSCISFHTFVIIKRSLRSTIPSSNAFLNTLPISGLISVACGTIKHAVSASDCSCYCFRQSDLL